MSARIAILDYGMGNLRSVEKALERVVVVDGLLTEIPLAQAHRLPAADVDGGQEDHAARRTKLRSSARPSGPDFSGWN